MLPVCKNFHLNTISFALFDLSVESRSCRARESSDHAWKISCNSTGPKASKILFLASSVEIHNVCASKLEAFPHFICVRSLTWKLSLYRSIVCLML